MLVIAAQIRFAVLRALLCMLQPLGTTDLVTVSGLCHTVGIIQQVAFPDRLLSLRNRPFRFFHGFSWASSSFPLSTK